MKRKTPEGYVLDACLGYLQAKGILAFRMGVGAMKVDNRFMRWGTPGMADILSFPTLMQADITALYRNAPQKPLYPVRAVLWIECKADNGRQSDLQKSFQNQVEEHGHIYVIARGVEDVQRALGITVEEL